MKSKSLVKDLESGMCNLQQITSTENKNNIEVGGPIGVLYKRAYRIKYGLSMDLTKENSRFAR